MTLTTERIREIERNHVYSQTATLADFARAIEAEVRGQDEALIRQLVDALEMVEKAMPFPVAQLALKAARARQEGKP